MSNQLDRKDLERQINEMRENIDEKIISLKQNDICSKNDLFEKRYWFNSINRAFKDKEGNIPEHKENDSAYTTIMGKGFIIMTKPFYMIVWKDKNDAVRTEYGMRAFGDFKENQEGVGTFWEKHTFFNTNDKSVHVYFAKNSSEVRIIDEECVREFKHHSEKIEKE